MTKNDKTYLILKNRSDLYKLQCAVEEHLKWWEEGHEDCADDEFIYNIQSEWIEALKRILNEIKFARKAPF